MALKATCVANTNIALIKYWGKRNDKLILPYNSSISVTADGLFAKTTVEFIKNSEQDYFEINKKAIKTDEPDYQKLSKYVEIWKQKGGIPEHKIKMVSQTNFPVAAGLASSAAGFAALAGAIDAALGLKTDHLELTQLARLGSGSASRSIFGGFVEWKKGEFDDGSDCYAEQLAKPEYWPEFRILFCITTHQEKKVKSRAGMAQTVKTCPLYQGWLDSIDADLDKMRIGLAQKDIKLVGEVAEHNALKMHATMIATIPAIIYWNGTTIEIIESVRELRKEGIDAYSTIDAGPQVKVICEEKNVATIKERLSVLPGIESILVSKPGEGIKIVDEHLF